MERDQTNFMMSLQEMIEMLLIDACFLSKRAGVVVVARL
jgi:hypothetical protein